MSASGVRPGSHGQTAKMTRMTLYGLAHCWNMSPRLVFAALSVPFWVDHEATRSHPLTREYDPREFGYCARAAVRATTPDRGGHAVPRDRSTRATSFDSLPATTREIRLDGRRES